MVAALSVFAARKHQHLLRPYPHAVYIEESQVKEHQSSTTYLKLHIQDHITWFPIFSFMLVKLRVVEVTFSFIAPL